MIKLIIIIILVMSLMDLGLTYIYLSDFHQKFPKIDYTTLEANPLLKLAMKQFGLTMGMIVGGIVIFIVLILIVLTLTERWLYYLTGIFTMMIVYHFLNISQLAALKSVG